MMELFFFTDSRHFMRNFNDVTMSQHVNDSKVNVSLKIDQVIINIDNNLKNSNVNEERQNILDSTVNNVYGTTTLAVLQLV